MKSSLFIGHAEDVLKSLPEKSVQCCITSPPYYALRKYDSQGQIGQEATIVEYALNLTNILIGVQRVLKDDGTLWLNLGDCYDKEGLVGVPWRMALTLKECGWILRSDIIWAKTNPMPSSVRNRPTSSHEHLFLFSKHKDYYYDAESIKEPLKCPNAKNIPFGGKKYPTSEQTDDTYSGRGYDASKLKGRNKRDVWSLATAGYKGAHFATFPKKLVEPCVFAGSRPGDLILDPFAGSGTTGVVALENKRDFLGIDISAEYGILAENRILEETGIKSEVNYVSKKG